MSDRPAVARSEDARPASVEPPGEGAGAASGADLGDTPVEAEGRRTLSTAFVMVGPDGLLTVDLRDGRHLVLKDVTMGPRKFCGALVDDKMVMFCAGYAAVRHARAGRTL